MDPSQSVPTSATTTSSPTQTSHEGRSKSDALTSLFSETLKKKDSLVKVTQQKAAQPKEQVATSTTTGSSPTQTSYENHSKSDALTSLVSKALKQSTNNPISQQTTVHQVTTNFQPLPQSKEHTDKTKEATDKVNQIAILERVTKFLEAQQHLSGVVLIAQHGKILFNHGYGMAVGTVENRSDTVVHVGSITKQFTAAAIMLLNEAGKIDLNASINRYLPPKYQCPSWEKVTVHHLLSHTSGIPDYEQNRSYYQVKRGFADAVTIDGMILDARDKAQQALKEGKKDLESEPGKNFKYCNFGYTLLGTIIEKQTDLPYRKFIKQHLLIPAGMLSSDIHDDSYIEKAKDARGHRWDEKEQTLLDDGNEKDLPVTPPDGGLFASTEDLLKWSDVLMKKRKGILSSESIDKMTTMPPSHYGYGLIIDRSSGNNSTDDVDNPSGTLTIWHPGHIVGFRSNFCLFPEREMFIVVLCNNTKINPIEITAELSKIMLEK